MKTAILILFAFIATTCFVSCKETVDAPGSTVKAVSMTDNRVFTMRKYCIENVTYLTYGNWSSVQLDENSKIVPCNK